MIHTEDGRDVETKCRRCSSCRDQWRKLWVGRFTAEAATSKAVWFVTLTYGGGDELNAAHVLDYRDVQRFWKMLRKLGFRFVYTVVGEYGTEGMRAHWHAMVFWETEPPKWPLNVRTGDERFRTRTRFVANEEAARCWPHGFLQAELPRSKQAAASYMMKYLDKPGVEKKFRFSRGRAIGWRCIEDYGRRCARNGGGLWPGEPFAYFTVPGNARTRPSKQEAARGFKGPFPLFRYGVDRDSVLVEYMARAYFDEWGNTRPEQKPPRVHDWAVPVLDRLNDTWNVTAGERRFLELVGYEDPGRIEEVRTKRQDTIALPEVPGLVLVSDRDNGARLYQYFDEEGRKLWQAPATDADVKQGVTVEVLPPRLRPVAEARARKERWKRELQQQEGAPPNWRG